MWLKAALASEGLFWQHIRDSATSWMGAGLKARSLRGECLSNASGGRKWRTENTERRARLLLRTPGHPASPSQGPLDTFPPAALQKTNQAMCRELVGGIWLRSTSRLLTSQTWELILRGQPPSTFPKQGTATGRFIKSLLYKPTKQQQGEAGDATLWLAVAFLVHSNKYHKLAS